MLRWQILLKSEMNQNTEQWYRYLHHLPADPDPVEKVAHSMTQDGDQIAPTAEQLQQHPEAAILLSLFGMLLLLVLVGGAIMWFTTLRRWRSGKPLLAIEPWTPRVWGLVDLIVVAVLIIAGQRTGIRLWARLTQTDIGALQQEADFPLSAMAVGSLSNLVVMLLTTLWLMLRYGASLKHIGFTSSRFFRLIGVGFGAALLSLPLMYAIMAFISLGLDEQYDHPLLNRMIQEGSLSAYLMAAFCAVVAAPLTEEFLFRVLFQGWLQSLPWSGQGAWWLLGASEQTRGATSAKPGYHFETAPLASGPAVASPAAAAGGLGGDFDQSQPSPMSASASQNPYEISARVVEPAGQPPIVIATQATITPPLWPAIVSGTLFGLAHWGYGLSFIPLIILGIILGLLYRAKHSIWPSFVVHFLLNLIAILGLGLSVYVKSITQ